MLRRKGGVKKITNSDKDLFKTFQCRRAISVSHICLPIVVKHKLYVDFIQYEYMDLPDISSKRDMSTNFYLKLIEPSARTVFIFWTLVEREEWGGG